MPPTGLAFLTTMCVTADDLWLLPPGLATTNATTAITTAAATSAIRVRVLILWTGPPARGLDQPAPSPRPALELLRRRSAEARVRRGGERADEAWEAPGRARRAGRPRRAPGDRPASGSGRPPAPARRRWPPAARASSDRRDADRPRLDGRRHRTQPGSAARARPGRPRTGARPPAVARRESSRRR